MRRAGRLLLAVPLFVLPGCSVPSFPETLAAEQAGRDTPPPASVADECPAERNVPDPDRPIIDYSFTLADDLRTVTGTETVIFTSDLRTDELVFRLVPNGPSRVEGSRVVVDAVRGADVAGGSYEAADATAPGGLYVVALDGALEPGERTRVELDFTLTLGTSGFERFGAEQGVSWWASGAPLLSWEPGVGWARDPFVDVLGETSTSPVADTTLTVSAPAELTVLMTGDMDPPTAPREGRRTWTSTEPAARDVSVAAGNFTTATATTPEGVAVTTGVLPGAAVDAEELAGWTVEAITALEERFGPFPYATLTVPLLPDHGGGIEYPSSILMAGAHRDVLVHEVAHMYFYGMVGGSQFRDPWLDEAFATYAQTVDEPLDPLALQRALDVEGDVGSSMAEFPDFPTYASRVYLKGGAALVAARDAAGPAAFDAAIRCYVDANAWTIATPDDVAAALAELPAALDVLLEVGALGQDDLQE